jgi:hypothetical protein
MSEMKHGERPDTNRMGAAVERLLSRCVPSGIACTPDLDARLEFDQTIFCATSGSAAGLVVLVVFAGQAILSDDRIRALLGAGCVGFVMLYLWWKHRDLQPLDPMLDLAAYRQAALDGRRPDPPAADRYLWYLLRCSFRCYGSWHEPGRRTPSPPG